MTKRGQGDLAMPFMSFFKDKGVNEPSAPYKELMMLRWVIPVNSLGGAPLLFGVVINPVSYKAVRPGSQQCNLAFMSIWM